MSNDFIQLKEFLYLLKKKMLIIVVVIFAFLIMTVIITKFAIKPMYESKTMVFIGKETNSSSTYDQWEIQMYQQLMQTYVELVNTENIVKNAIDNINLNKDVEDVLEKLTVTQKVDTQILEISYKSNDSNESFEVVTAITDEFIKKSKEIIPNGDIEIIQEAKIPKEPLTDNLLRNMVLAFIGACILSVTLILLLDFFDDTFKNKNEVERNIGIPIIGIIPEYNQN